MQFAWHEGILGGESETKSNSLMPLKARYSGALISILVSYLA
jgi:hypothetical protein